MAHFPVAIYSIWADVAARCLLIARLQTRTYRSLGALVTYLQFAINGKRIQTNVYRAIPVLERYPDAQPVGASRVLYDCKNRAPCFFRLQCEPPQGSRAICTIRSLPSAQIHQQYRSADGLELPKAPKSRFGSPRRIGSHAQ